MIAKHNKINPLRFRITFVFLLMFFVPATGQCQQALKLWYDEPAGVWTEALPVGNGRLGAMVWGGTQNELIQLNEATLWSGGPVETNVNPNAPDYLPKVRRAIFNHEYQKADSLTKYMQGLYSESYMPMGDLLIRQHLDDTTVTDYYRDLNISDAVTTTRFKAGNTQYTRQVFVSAPDQVIVFHLTAKGPGKLNLQIDPRSKLRNHTSRVSNKEWVMKGKAPAHVDPNYVHYHEQPIIYKDPSSCDGMRFEVRIKATDTDGLVQANSNGISLKNASEATFLVSGTTSFNGFDTCPDKDGRDEDELAGKHLDDASGKSFEQLLDNHEKDYHKYFNRVSLTLGDGDRSVSREQLPTDQRLKQYSSGAKDPGLETLYFQYGRYLMISSSRTPGAPANLQGIWNQEMRPPWSSNYTININTEMNYWPAEVTNLSEMHKPLFDLVKKLSVTGKTTARRFYNADGWVAHHNTDIWGLSNPVGDKGHGSPVWANWAMGGNWLSRQLWDHYRFTGDTEFLRNTAYPIMKGAAEFCLDWLVKDGKGHWVTAPSVSPEIPFRYDDGKTAQVSMATTMDMSIIRDLFSHVIEAGKILDRDAAFLDILLARKEHLYPFKVGERGNIQEWYKDWKAADIHHRHVSHLYGLYPAHEISLLRTPYLAKAARRTLEIRGDAGTGWSLAWKINFWARLLDGNHAHRLIEDLLQLTRENDTNYQGRGGTYPNMFDAHPPFQIDGNFGGTAGMAEMLIQSQLDGIYLLPALPDDWQEGEVTGLRARANFEIDMQWDQKTLIKAVIKSFGGNKCIVRTNVPVKVKGTDVQSEAIDTGYITSFDTEKNHTYIVRAK